MRVERGSVNVARWQVKQRRYENTVKSVCPFQHPLAGVGRPRRGRDYVLTLLADDPADASVPRGYRCETRTVRKGDVLTVKMSASGGFCGTIADKH